MSLKLTQHPDYAALSFDASLRVASLHLLAVQELALPQLQTD